MQIATNYQNSSSRSEGKRALYPELPTQRFVVLLTGLGARTRSHCCRKTLRRTNTVQNAHCKMRLCAYGKRRHRARPPNAAERDKTKINECTPVPSYGRPPLSCMEAASLIYPPVHYVLYVRAIKLASHKRRSRH